MCLTLIGTLLSLLLLAGSSLQDELNIEDQPRIFKGKETTPNSAPYQAALTIKDKKGQGQFCGGSLITTSFVLTAAHCVNNAQAIIVTLGGHSLDEDTPSTVTMHAKRVAYHQRYDEDTVVNDIAVVELVKPVKLNKYITTVKLPTKAVMKNSLVGKYGKLMGWGATSDRMNEPNDVLKELRVRIVSVKECIGYKIDKDQQICAFGQNSGSACVGDSGGPLLLENTNIQIGLVSYGAQDGCSLGYAHIYTNVYWHLDWIQKYSDYQA